jgi:hypothetical protein
MTDDVADDDGNTGLSGATDDLRVAVVAAACTIGLTLALRYGVGREVAFAYRLLPLAPYFVSLFAGRVLPDGLDTPRTWSVLTAGLTTALFVYFGLL